MSTVRLSSPALVTALLLALAGPGRADEPIVIPSAAMPAGGAGESGGAGGAVGRPATSGSGTAAPVAAPSPEATPNAWHQRHDEYFRRNWGVEVLGVHPVSSGYMLQLRYRILDGAKAAVLNEKRSKAFVIDEATDTRLAVPAMENIGELRQTPRPEEGRTYYILFGNPGKLVKPGAKVDVVVGRFRADGIIVE